MAKKDKISAVIVCRALTGPSGNSSFATMDMGSSAVSGTGQGTASAFRAGSTTRTSLNADNSASSAKVSGKNASNAMAEAAHRRETMRANTSANVDGGTATNRDTGGKGHRNLGAVCSGSAADYSFISGTRAINGFMAI